MYIWARPVWELRSCCGFLGELRRIPAACSLTLGAGGTFYCKMIFKWLPCCEFLCSFFQKSVKGLRGFPLRCGAAPLKKYARFFSVGRCCVGADIFSFDKTGIAWQYLFWQTDTFFLSQSAKLIDFCAVLFCMGLEKSCTKQILGTTICIVLSGFLIVNGLCLFCKRCPPWLWARPAPRLKFFLFQYSFLMSANCCSRTIKLKFWLQFDCNLVSIRRGCF